MTKLVGNSNNSIQVKNAVKKSNWVAGCWKGQSPLERNPESEKGIKSSSTHPVCQLTTASVRNNTYPPTYNSKEKQIMDMLPNLVVDMEHEEEEGEIFSSGSSCSSPAQPSSPTLTYTPGNDSKFLPPKPHLTRTVETSSCKNTAGTPKREIVLLDSCTRCTTWFLHKEQPASLSCNQLLAAQFCPLCRSRPICPECGSPDVDFTSTFINKAGQQQRRRIITVNYCNSAACSWPLNAENKHFQYEEIESVY